MSYFHFEFIVIKEDNLSFSIKGLSVIMNKLSFHPKDKTRLHVSCVHLYYEYEGSLTTFLYL